MATATGRVKTQGIEDLKDRLGKVVDSEPLASRRNPNFEKGVLVPIGSKSFEGLAYQEPVIAPAMAWPARPELAELRGKLRQVVDSEGTVEGMVGKIEKFMAEDLSGAKPVRGKEGIWTDEDYVRDDMMKVWNMLAAAIGPYNNGHPTRPLLELLQPIIYGEPLEYKDVAMGLNAWPTRTKAGPVLAGLRQELMRITNSNSRDTIDGLVGAIGNLLVTAPLASAKRYSLSNSGPGAVLKDDLFEVREALAEAIAPYVHVEGLGEGHGRKTAGAAVQANGENAAEPEKGHMDSISDALRRISSA